VCCSVLQCVAVRCSVLQRERRFISAFTLPVRCVSEAATWNSDGMPEVCCSVLQCVAVCCGGLQCVAVGYSVLQHERRFISAFTIPVRCVSEAVTWHPDGMPEVCCSVLQCVAVCCSVSQCVAWRCSVLQRVAACSSVS